MRKPIIIISIIVFLGIAGGAVYAWQSGSEETPYVEDQTTTIEEQETPETVNTSQKANVEEPEESDETTTTIPEETGGSLVISELSPPSGSGFPVQTNHFEIEIVKSGTYSVKLLAIINNPNQYQEYRAQLKQFKKEALAYLTSQDVNTATANITYQPSEAEDL